MLRYCTYRNRVRDVSSSEPQDVQETATMHLNSLDYAQNDGRRLGCLPCALPRKYDHVLHFCVLSGTDRGFYRRSYIAA